VTEAVLRESQLTLDDIDWRVLVKLTTAIGLRTPTVRPRMHDLRHRFAVDALIRMQRSGEPDAGPVSVSGHVNPAGTWWYVSATPELMDRRAARGSVRRTAMTALAPALQAPISPSG